MSEQSTSNEKLARVQHGLRRFTGKSILTYEQKKQFDRENSGPDPLGGILHPNWEDRKAEMEAEANRPAISRAIRSFGRWVVGWWEGEPNLTTGDTNLIITEEDFLEHLAGESDGTNERMRAEVERAAAAFEGFQPDPDPNGFYDEFRRGRSNI